LQFNRLPCDIGEPVAFTLGQTGTHRCERCEIAGKGSPLRCQGARAAQIPGAKHSCNISIAWHLRVLSDRGDRSYGFPCGDLHPVHQFLIIQGCERTKYAGAHAAELMGDRFNRFQVGARHISAIGCDLSCAPGRHVSPFRFRKRALHPLSSVPDSGHIADRGRPVIVIVENGTGTGVDGDVVLLVGLHRATRRTCCKNFGFGAIRTFAQDRLTC